MARPASGPALKRRFSEKTFENVMGTSAPGSGYLPCYRHDWHDFSDFRLKHHNISKNVKSLLLV
jgi:hypothetical protein